MTQLELSHKMLVERLAKRATVVIQDLDDNNRLFGSTDLLHGAVGICGEAGELLDAAKKTFFYSQTADHENIIEELGDLEFYMELVRKTTGITREECLQANLDKLTKRYPEGYTNKAAKERADKGGE